jgi:hypothetical protein
MPHLDLAPGQSDVSAAPARFGVTTSALRLKPFGAIVLLIVGAVLTGDVVRAQATPDPGPSTGEQAKSRRIRWAFAGGPALEVATPGERQREGGVLAVPSLAIGVASWFELVIEGHAAGYVTPVGGHMVGVVPIGWRLHAPGRIQPYVSGGAGLTWTNLTGLTGLERRRNYLTQIGGGVRHTRANGSAVSVEARLFHLSNLSSAPPNLGMEVFAVLVGYRLPM